MRSSDMKRNYCAVLASIFFLLAAPIIAEAEDNASAPKRPGDLRIPDKLSQGDPAPGFRLHGKSEVALADFKGKKPVVLIFGSYT